MKNATRITTATFGTLMGLAGLEHGIGEALQGNIAPAGIMFASWPRSELFRIVGGEPAMTVVPNLLVTGAVAILLSMIFIAWAILFVQKKNGGLVLILLSIAMLLVGGGFAPPILGLIIGAAATTINAPLIWWRTHLSLGLRGYLRNLWPWSFSACVIALLLMFPGSIIIGHFFGVSSPSLIYGLALCTLATLLLTIFAGLAYDIKEAAP
jgi:hypothetical protein